MKIKAVSHRIKLVVPLYLEKIVLVLSIYTLAALMIQLLYKLPENTNNILQSIDTFVCLIFLFEVFYRFSVASNKLKFFITWGWIDLLSSIPYLSVFRFGRIVRIIRIFRLLRTVRASKALVPHIVKLGAKNTALAVALSTGLFIVVSIIAMLNFETTPASNITTIMDAVWWGFGTVTMEGSDKYPVTVEGKIVAIMLMIMGIVCFSIFTSYITNAFTNMTNKNNEDSVDSLKKQLSRLEAQLESIQTQLSDFVPASRPEAIGQRDDLN